MDKLDISHIQWRKPWHPILPIRAPHSEAELHRELCPKHVLFGRPVSAIGYRQDCDDVLFYLGEIAPRFAVVHLTFQPETNPKWPETSLYESIEDWVEQCMIPDATDFEL